MVEILSTIIGASELPVNDYSFGLQYTTRTWALGTIVRLVTVYTNSKKGLMGPGGSLYIGLLQKVQCSKCLFWDHGLSMLGFNFMDSGFLLVKLF